MIHFGLGKERAVYNITVHLANDEIVSIDNLQINRIIDLKPQVNAINLVSADAALEIEKGK